MSESAGEKTIGFEVLYKTLFKKTGIATMSIAAVEQKVCKVSRYCNSESWYCYMQYTLETYPWVLLLPLHPFGHLFKVQREIGVR